MNGHILITPMEEVRREPDGDTRWCFVCRRHQPFEHVVRAPIVEPPQRDDDGTLWFSTGAYYGPSHSIECTVCHTADGDCFPGTYREWE